MRETTITVSYKEKRMLDDAAVEIFGTDELAYGATIQYLCRKTLDDAVEV